MYTHVCFNQFCQYFCIKKVGVFFPLTDVTKAFSDCSLFDFCLTSLHFSEELNYSISFTTRQACMLYLKNSEVNLVTKQRHKQNKPVYRCSQFRNFRALQDQVLILLTQMHVNKITLMHRYGRVEFLHSIRNSGNFCKTKVAYRNLFVAAIGTTSNAFWGCNIVWRISHGGSLSCSEK